MPATVSFYIPGSNINLNGSGLGFYGSTFGDSVDVGQTQTTTYITNSNGTLQGAQGNNIRRVNNASGIVGSSTSGIWLTQIPNYQATLNIRFENDTPVKIQNCRAYVYDRANINNNPSGVTCYVAEIIHPGLLQSDNTGSGDTTWINAKGSGTTVPLAPSPGMSGLYAGNGLNGNALSARHDHFLAISASPDSIGSKLFALQFACEYI